MASLYNIDKALYDLLEQGFNDECIDEETGEILDDKANVLLDSYNGDRIYKIENIALYVKELGLLEDGIKTEEDALKKRRQAYKNKRNRLISYIDNSMSQFGDTKIETAKVVLKYLKSKAVEIEDEHLIPLQYFKTKIENVVDKQLIKQAISKGEEVPGAVLVTRNNLQIK